MAGEERALGVATTHVTCNKFIGESGMTFALNGSTPIAQRADASQVAITDSGTGTVSDTIAAGVGVSVMSFPFEFTTNTSAIDVVTAFVPGYKFKILDWAWVDGGTLLVGSSGSQVVNMEIGTTDVGTSPSTITVVQSGTADGRRIDGTTVTGANTGSASDTFSIEIANSGTDITAGNGAFHVVIQNMDTADAFASISDKWNEIRTTLVNYGFITGAA